MANPAPRKYLIFGVAKALEQSLIILSISIPWDTAPSIKKNNNNKKAAVNF